MDKDSKIREAQTRVIEVFKKRPQKALCTIKGTASIENGLTCMFTQGEQQVTMDMPKIMGGDDAGPTPGFYARAGIAGCASMAIKQAAVLAGHVLDKVTIDIETDFDDSAAFGLGDASAAPLETRFAIRIKTNLPESEVDTLVEQALGMDPWFLALRDAQSAKFNVVVDR